MCRARAGSLQASRLHVHPVDEPRQLAGVRGQDGRGGAVRERMAREGVETVCVEDERDLDARVQLAGELGAVRAETRAEHDRVGAFEQRVEPVQPALHDLDRAVGGLGVRGDRHVTRAGALRRHRSEDGRPGEARRAADHDDGAAGELGRFGVAAGQAVEHARLDQSGLRGRRPAFGRNADVDHVHLTGVRFARDG